MTNQRFLIIIAIVIGIAAASAGIGSYIAQQSGRGTETPPGLMWPNPKSFPEVTLYNQAGEDFTEHDLKGHWSLVFFGFTHCPDICPATLSVLDQVEQQVSERQVPDKQLRVIFISVDPKRDTPEQLANYVTYFNDEFIGASGTREALDTLTRSLGTIYHIGKSDEQGDYQVDHSASIFLFDPRARLVSVFTTPHEADSITERFLAIRKFIQQQDG